jgi:hypothetical protein
MRLILLLAAAAMGLGMSYAVFTLAVSDIHLYRGRDFTTAGAVG